MNHEQKIENAATIIAIEMLERGGVSVYTVMAIDDRLCSEFPRADELRIALECLWACLDEMDVTA